MAFVKFNQIGFSLAFSLINVLQMPGINFLEFGANLCSLHAVYFPCSSANASCFYGVYSSQWIHILYKNHKIAYGLIVYIFALNNRFKVDLNF